MSARRSREKAKLLFVSAHLPVPDAREAGQKTAFRNLLWLCERFRVVLVAFRNAQELRYELRALRELCERIELVDVTDARRALGVLSRPELPLAVGVRWSRRAARIIRSLLSKIDFCRVHCEWGQMAVYAPLFRPVPVRTLNLHDVLHQWCDRRAQVRTGLARFWWKVEAARARRWEAQSYGQFSCIYVPTEKDRRLVAELSPGVAAKTWVLGHHVARFGAGRSGSGGSGRAIVFWGALGREENAAGVRWLVREVLPLLRSRMAGVEVLVVGADPPDWLQKLEDPSVFVTGYVKDPAPYFERARVAALPLFSGAGVKIKVLECLAAGIPVVTTPAGAEGIAAGPEDGLLVSEARPEDFAAQLVYLLEDPETAARLGSAARRWAEQNLRDDRELLLNPPIDRSEQGWRSGTPKRSAEERCVSSSPASPASSEAT